MYEENYDAMRDYCLRRLPTDDANDGLAEIFLVAWRRLDDVPAGEQARLWLFGVARRVVSTMERSTRRRSRLTAKSMAQADTGAVTIDTGTVVVRRSEDARLLEAIGSLRPSDQELVRLKAWEELSHADIGEVLGISSHAVDMRLNRALKKVGRLMRPANRKMLNSPRPVEEGGEL